MYYRKEMKQMQGCVMIVFSFSDGWKMWWGKNVDVDVET